MPAIEWDVFQMRPGSLAPLYLATLYTAQKKSIRVELDGTGSGSFEVNRTAPECTEAILAQGNLVKVRIPEIHTDYIFAFFLETGDFTLISSQEAGGEALTFGGRGNLAYTEYAVAWFESFVTGGTDPIAGVWQAYAAGTGNKPGQILRRMLEEMQHVDRPQQPLPYLTIDFDYSLDSAGNAWIATSATDEFKYQVGEPGLAIVERLLETDKITLQMDPDFELHAYNRESYGRDLSGAAFGAGVVRFVRGVNIATELRRELPPSEVVTVMLVSGENDKYARATLSDAATRVTREGYIASYGEGGTALVGVGATELRRRLAVSDRLTFPINNRRTVVSLADPVTVGSVIGDTALQGAYLPGPAGTNGDFWVGDTVRVHTGAGAFDYDEVDALVTAITIAREDDNHELVVIPELRTQPGMGPAYAELWAASYGPAGSGPVYFIYDGDDPPSGTAGTPLVGALEYIDVGTGHTPQYHSAAHRGGILVTGNGTLTMRYIGDFITVGWSNRDYIASIRVNGVTVASHTVNKTEGIGEWDVLATDIDVVAGDVIEVYEASLPGTVFLTPSGTGGGHFWVTGNLAPA